MIHKHEFSHDTEFRIARVSKSCNNAITRLRKMSENLRKMSENLRKSLAKERKTGRTGITFMFVSQLDNFNDLQRFFGIFYACLCGTFLNRKFRVCKIVHV